MRRAIFILHLVTLNMACPCLLKGTGDNKWERTHGARAANQAASLENVGWWHFWFGLRLFLQYMGSSPFHQGWQVMFGRAQKRFRTTQQNAEQHYTCNESKDIYSAEAGKESRNKMCFQLVSVKQEIKLTSDRNRVSTGAVGNVERVRFWGSLSGIALSHTTLFVRRFCKTCQVQPKEKVWIERKR